MIRQLLAFPFYPPPPLSRVSSVGTLRRHMMLAIERGLFPVAAEYQAEIERREKPEFRKAA
jgi:hypothetical protein